MKTTKRNIQMKRIILLVAVVATGAISALAQQVPMYSHYYYNKFIYNPAMAGVQNYGQIYLINRNQWNKIPNAPVSRALTMDGPLRKKNIGIGMAVFRDEAGAYNITGGQAAYRYGLKFNEEQTLSFGLALGFLDNRIDFRELVAKDQLDPVLMNSYQNSTGFDANIGLNYTFNALNVGVSIPQIIGNELAYDALANPQEGDVIYGVARHVIFNANYDWDISGDGTWYLEPTALVRLTPGAPFQWDINAMFSYQHKYWVGIMYRSMYAMTFSTGLRLADQFVAGYAYDMVVNSERQYLRGAHEFLLGYQFGGRVTEDPELKRKLREIDDKIKNNKEEIDTLSNKVDENTEDIQENKEDIEENKEDINDLDEKLQSFDDFLSLFNEDGTPKKPGAVKIDGELVQFSSLYFETNKWDVMGDPKELEKLAEILKSNPNMKIEVAGHTDARGSESYNIWLSNKRANAVREYLIKLGVNPEQIVVKGYGKEAPSGEGYNKDRRVEFKVLSK